MGSFNYYLFSSPSFLSGIARSLDIEGSFDTYNFSRSPEEADTKESYEDWIAVYCDLFSAWQQIATENPDFINELSEAITKDEYLSRIAELNIEICSLEANAKAP